MLDQFVVGVEGIQNSIGIFFTSCGENNHFEFGWTSLKEINAEGAHQVITILYIIVD